MSPSHLYFVILFVLILWCVLFLFLQIFLSLMDATSQTLKRSNVTWGKCKMFQKKNGCVWFASLWWFGQIFLLHQQIDQVILCLCPWCLQVMYEQAHMIGLDAVAPASFLIGVYIAVSWSNSRGLYSCQKYIPSIVLSLTPFFQITIKNCYLYTYSSVFTNITLVSSITR